MLKHKERIARLEKESKRKERHLEKEVLREAEEKIAAAAAAWPAIAADFLASEFISGERCPYCGRRTTAHGPTL